jgi:hypothetical protein
MSELTKFEKLGTKFVYCICIQKMKVDLKTDEI